MSKRHAVDAKGGALSIYPLDLRDLGYLPEGVLNWLALMGWSYDDHTEIFTLSELVERFALERLSPSPAAVNFSKLDHFNGIHLRALPPDELARRLLPIFGQAGLTVDEARLACVVPLIQERIRTLDEAVDMAGFFFREAAAPDAAALRIADLTMEQSAELFDRAHATTAAVAEWRAAEIEAPLRALAEASGLSAGQLFGALRMAITGQAVSPPLFETMEIVGRPPLCRLQSAGQALRLLA
jgi:glutamyl-tRNA synthetase